MTSAGGYASDGLRFAEGDYVSLGVVSDLYELLRAIGESLPTDATLFIEGTSIASEIKRFLIPRQADAAARREVDRGTVWPAAETFHLPLSDDNLAELRALSENYAEPEICDHLAVYRGNELLLWAPDAGDGEVQVAHSLGEEALERFKSSLGDSLKKRE